MSLESSVKFQNKGRNKCNMSAILHICIHSIPTKETSHSVPFESKDLNPDSALKLSKTLHELFLLIGPCCEELKVDVLAEVTDSDCLVKFARDYIEPRISVHMSDLTRRELEIIGLIMQGNTSEEIAKRLFISFETVKCHRKHILEKTGAKNTAELISYFHQTFFDK